MHPYCIWDYICVVPLDQSEFSNGAAGIEGTRRTCKRAVHALALCRPQHSQHSVGGDGQGPHGAYAIYQCHLLLYGDGLHEPEGLHCVSCQPGPLGKGGRGERGGQWLC